MARTRSTTPHRTAAAILVALVAVAAGVVAPASAQPAPPRHGLGLAPEAPSRYLASSFAASKVTASGTLPASVDLTADAPPAGNQGWVNSCVSWAIGYTAMGYFLNRDGIAGAPLAPMYTYSQVHLPNDGGSYFSDTFDVASTQGVDTKSHYTKTDYDWRALPSRGEVANARNWVLTGVHPLAVGYDAATTKSEIKTALAAGKPVVLGMTVYDGFFGLSAGHSDWGSASGSFAGYHAVTAFGYDSYGVTIENSWGTAWGDDGFARLSWPFVASDVFTAYAVDGVEARPDAPVVQTVQPAIGPVSGGNTVTLTGVNFASNATVRVGGVAATSVDVDGSGTHLTARVPAHSAARAPVVVTTDDGPSATNPYAQYRYEPAPSVASVSARVVPVAGGNHVTIAGSSFRSAAVTFGKSDASETVNRAGTSIDAVAPPHAAGVVTLWVKTPAGAVSAGSLRYAAAPVVHGVTPRAGGATGGTRVVVSGSHLLGARVTFGGRAATVVSNTDTQIAVRTPRGTAGARGTIVVRTGGGSVSAGSYTWR
jgi:hypothetical protein